MTGDKHRYLEMSPNVPWGLSQLGTSKSCLWCVLTFRDMESLTPVFRKACVTKLPAFTPTQDQDSPQVFSWAGEEKWVSHKQKPTCVGSLRIPAIPTSPAGKKSS
jgi:hypothetical protein